MFTAIAKGHDLKGQRPVGIIHAGEMTRHPVPRWQPKWDREFLPLFLPMRGAISHCAALIMYSLYAGYERRLELTIDGAARARFKQQNVVLNFSFPSGSSKGLAAR